MSAPRETAAVNVWRDDVCASDRGCDVYYSVSEVDDAGDEIRCSGGSRRLSRAWEIGLELAEDLGVPCVEYAGPDGVVTDRWDPPAAADDDEEA